MQTTINIIKSAHGNTISAIHEAFRAFGDNPEFAVLLARLQEAANSLREADNQAVRIKSRRDLEAGRAGAGYYGHPANSEDAPKAP